MGEPDDYGDDECQHCGGEGRVAGTCIDGCCLEQDDPDCEFCSHVCEFCHPPTPEQIKSRDELRQVLSDALDEKASSRQRPTDTDAGLVKRQIAHEIYKAVERLDGSPDLLSVIGSYGDTLDDVDVLSLLKNYNETGTIMRPFQ